LIFKLVPEIGLHGALSWAAAQPTYLGSEAGHYKLPRAFILRFEGDAAIERSR
jgi:hypothetical protein